MHLTLERLEAPGSGETWWDGSGKWGYPLRDGVGKKGRLGEDNHWTVKKLNNNNINNNQDKIYFVM